MRKVSRSIPNGVKVELCDGTNKIMSIDDLLSESWGLADKRCLEKGEAAVIRRMQAIYLHIQFDKPLPEELKNWFLGSLDKHAVKRGALKLDEIFGYEREENKRNAYTHADDGYTYHLIWLMKLLRQRAKVGKSAAARLILWREQSDRLTTNSLVRRYDDSKTELEPVETIHYENHEQLCEIANEYYTSDSAFLDSFLDAESRLKALPIIEKDLTVVRKARDLMAFLTPLEYFDMMTGN